MDPKAALDAIEAELNALVQAIKTNPAVQVAEHLPGVQGIIDWITGSLSVIEANLQTFSNTVVAQLENQIQNAIPSAIDVIGNLIRTLTNDIESTIQNLATAEDFATSVVNVLKGQAPHLAPWIHNLIVGGFGNMSLGVLRTLELENPEAIDPILDELAKVHLLPAYLRPAVEHARKRGAPWFIFLIPAIILAALIPILNTLAEPTVEALRQGIWSNEPTKELDPEAITELRFLGLIQEKEWRDRLSHWGYNTDVQDFLAAVREKLLGPENAVRAFYRGEIGDLDLERELQGHGFSKDRRNTFANLLRPLLPQEYIREALQRGLINPDQHDKALGQYGYASETAMQLRHLYEVLPSPFIVRDMATRGAFDPQAIQRFELLAEYPEAFSTLLRHQGFSQETAYGLWVAHWAPTSPGVATELLRRTVDEPLDKSAAAIPLSDGSSVYPVISRETYLEALRLDGVSPFYRDKLAAVAYQPYQRREIRGLAKMGILTDAQVERAFLDTGASPDKAKRLAQWVQAVNATEAKDKGTAILDELRKTILRLYVAEKIDASDAAFVFADLGFTDEEADQFLTEAKLVQAVNDAEAVESGIGRLYVASYIQRDEAIARLANLSVPDAGINRLLAKWDIEIEYNADRRLSPATRELTKAEVLDAYKAGMILEQDTRQFLSHNGYPPDEIDVLISLANYQASRDARKAQQDALKSLYVNGVRERLDISNALDASGMLVQQRDALLAEWDLLREQRTEKLPLATLREAVRVGLLDVDAATVQLRRHRLSEDDISLMIALWQIPPKQGGKSRAAVS